MIMQRKVFVLGMSRYKFANQENGEIIQGTKVSYVDLEYENTENTVGAQPQAANFPLEFYDTMNKQQIPGVYNADLDISLQGRKPTVKVTAFHYVGHVDLHKSYQPAAVK